MQIILTEEEYHQLKADVEGARSDAKDLAIHMAAEWVKKAIPVIKDTIAFSNPYGDPGADILKRLSAIKIE